MGDGVTTLSRDDARQHWAASGLNFAVLTPANLTRLRDLLDEQMRDFLRRFGIPVPPQRKGAPAPNTPSPDEDDDDEGDED